MTRLIIILCLLPGAAVTIYSLATVYQSMGSGAEIDEVKLRAGINQGINWMVIGLAVAVGLLLLRVIYRLLRPRRRIE